MVKVLVMKRPARAVGYTHYSPAEVAAVGRMKAQGKGAQEVAGALGRDVSSVARHFKRLESAGHVKPVGRPPALTTAQVDLLVKRAEKMIEDADCHYQVTSSMVKAACKIKCSDSVVLEALHSRGVYFHPFREKPLRTEDDVLDRAKFAKDNKSKPASFWETGVHAYIDNKWFSPYLTSSARSYARKVTARGAFRARGQGLAKGHVKPKRTLKQNFGKSVQVAVAISAKKVLMCHQVPGNWNKEAACDMYQNHLAPALRKAYPSKRQFVLLEDNDPVGYKSKAAVDVKASEKVVVYPIPKRSPDLNPLDFGFWSRVNSRLPGPRGALPSWQARISEGFRGPAPQDHHAYFAHFSLEAGSLHEAQMLGFAPGQGQGLRGVSGAAGLSCTCKVFQATCHVYKVHRPRHGRSGVSGPRPCL